MNEENSNTIGQQSQSQTENDKRVMEFEFHENTGIEAFKHTDSQQRDNSKIITLKDPNSFGEKSKQWLTFSNLILLSLAFLFIYALYTKPTISAPFLESDKLSSIETNYYNQNAISTKLSANHDIYLNNQYLGRTSKIEVPASELLKSKTNTLRYTKIYNFGPFVFSGSEMSFTLPESSISEPIEFQLKANRKNVDVFFNNKKTVVDPNDKSIFRTSITPKELLSGATSKSVQIPYYSVGKNEESQVKNVDIYFEANPNLSLAKCDNLAIIYNPKLVQAKDCVLKEADLESSNIIITKTKQANQSEGKVIKQNTNKLNKVIQVIETDKNYLVYFESNGTEYKVSTSDKKDVLLTSLYTLTDFLF
jgi:hypothetical protein